MGIKPLRNSFVVFLSLLTLVASLTVFAGGSTSPARADMVSDAEQLILVSKTKVFEARKHLREVRKHYATTKKRLKEAEANVRVTTVAEVTANKRAFAARKVMHRMARESYMNSSTNRDLTLIVGLMEKGPDAVSDLAWNDGAWRDVQFVTLADAQAAVGSAKTAASASDAALLAFERAGKDVIAAQKAVTAARTALSMARVAVQNARAALERARAVAACQTAGLPQGPGGSAQYVWQTLLGKGFTKEAIAGVLGNFQQESGIDPTSEQANGVGKGLAQWSAGGRWDTGSNSMLAYSNKKQLDPWKISTQVKFMLFEMRNNVGGFDIATFRRMSNTVDATIYFHDRFEASADSDDFVRTVRGQFAKEWYTKLENVGPRDENYGEIVDLGVYCDSIVSGGKSCPPVPQTFKDSFSMNTGFSWDSLTPDAQLMSRCVHANFPQIVVHGTYAGHMPTEAQAIDFMVPNDCQNTAAGPSTTTNEDLVLGTELTKYLSKYRTEIGVDYMIWQDHIRNPGEHVEENLWVPIDQWRQDDYNNGDCNNSHYNHVHVSVYGNAGTGMGS